MVLKKKRGDFDVLIDRGLEVPMRDGTILRADTWRPDAKELFRC